MLAGYILNRYKAAPSFITPLVNFVLWMLSLLMLFLLVFGVWNGTLDRALTALYVSVGHTGNWLSSTKCITQNFRNESIFNNVPNYSSTSLQNPENKYLNYRFRTFVCIPLLELNKIHFPPRICNMNVINHFSLICYFRFGCIWHMCKIIPPQKQKNHRKPNKTAWGLALMWITLSCKWGLAKPIDKLLSHRTLLPMSRLTYCAYLIHPVSQIVMSLELKGTIHIQHGLVLTIFLGNAITAYTIALIISLLFEAPVVRILKILFGR